MDRHLTYGLTQLGDIQPKPIYVDENRRVGVVLESGTAVKLILPTEISRDVVTTSSIGTQYVSLPPGACNIVEIANSSGVTIEYIVSGTGGAFPIFSSSGKLITGVSNSSDVSVRRVDLSSTPVTVPFARYV